MRKALVLLVLLVLIGIVGCVGTAQAISFPHFKLKFNEIIEPKEGYTYYTGVKYLPGVGYVYTQYKVYTGEDYATYMTDRDYARVRIIISTGCGWGILYIDGKPYAVVRPFKPFETYYVDLPLGKHKIKVLTFWMCKVHHYRFYRVVYADEVTVYIKEEKKYYTLSNTVRIGSEIFVKP